jgi:hypothetical protein
VRVLLLLAVTEVAVAVGWEAPGEEVEAAIEAAWAADEGVIYREEVEEVV